MGDPVAKQLLEARCKVQWPCATNDKGLGGSGMAPEYEPSPSTMCPTGSGWTFNQATGMCDAPSQYGGTCARSVNLLGYSAGMKAQWGHACIAAWPLGKKKPPEIPEEPILPPNQMREDPLAIEDNGLDESDPFKHLDDPDISDPKVRRALVAGQGQRLPSRSDPSQATWA